MKQSNNQKKTRQVKRRIKSHTHTRTHTGHTHRHALVSKFLANFSNSVTKWQNGKKSEQNTFYRQRSYVVTSSFDGCSNKQTKKKRELTNQKRRSEWRENSLYYYDYTVSVELNLNPVYRLFIHNLLYTNTHTPAVIVLIDCYHLSVCIQRERKIVQMSKTKKNIKRQKKKN